MDTGLGPTVPLEAGIVDDKARTEPHERGALLASAVLEAFLGAYQERTRDLLRLNGAAS